MPFLLLPFRPGTDAVGSKGFIRNFFKMQHESTWQNTSLEVRTELMLMEPIVSFPGTPLLTRLTSYPGSVRHHEVVLE